MQVEDSLHKWWTVGQDDDGGGDAEQPLLVDDVGKNWGSRAGTGTGTGKGTARGRQRKSSPESKTRASSVKRRSGSGA